MEYITNNHLSSPQQDLEQPDNDTAGSPMQAFSQQLNKMMTQQQQMFSELHQRTNLEKKIKEAEDRHREELREREEERKKIEDLRIEEEQRIQLEQQPIIQSSASVNPVNLIPAEDASRETLPKSSVGDTLPLDNFLAEIEIRLGSRKRPRVQKIKSQELKKTKVPIKVIHQNFNCFDCKRELKGKCSNCRIRLLQCLVIQQKKELAYERNLRMKAESKLISEKRKRTGDKKKRNTSSKRFCRLKTYALVIEFVYVKLSASQFILIIFF